MNPISFTSRVNIDFNSIKKHMPDQEHNIVNAAIALSKNGDNNDVFVKATTPYVVELEISKPNGQPKIISAIDPRPMTAIMSSMSKEDFYYQYKPHELKSKQSAIDEKYAADMRKIEGSPFDFESKILKTYNSVEL
jgi:hypothetical protein